MAIAVDAVTPNTWTSPAGSSSFSHTCTAATALLVFVVMDDVTDGDRVMSSMTYNGVSLAQAKRQDNAADNLTAEIWYLGNPSSGANTLAYTVGGGTISRGTVTCVSFTGTDTSTVIGVTDGQNISNNGSPSSTITTGTANSWVVDCIAYGGAGITPDGSQTELFTEDFSIFGSGNSSYETTTSAGTVTMSWTGGGATDDAAHALVELLSDGAVTAISSKRLLNSHGR